MNMGQIKASPGDQSTSVHPDVALKKQLQEQGLKQAAEFQQRQSASVQVSSTQTLIGLKVFSHSMEKSVEVDGQKPPAEKAEQEDKPASLFDFEKVARNVMNFVGGVIQSAAQNGADPNKLGGLFSQARSGVARGIAMAQRDLNGLMNGEISEGIDRSRTLIDKRLNELEARLLGEEPFLSTESANTIELAASESKQGSLRIKTRDGDEVQLRFESLRAFEVNASNISSLTENASESEDQSQTAETRYQYYEYSGMHFSLKGELDEGELTAIGDLVKQTHELADTFFAGDLDKAFERALQLGFDDQELTGYALQLTRETKAQVVQTYEDIKHYRDDKPQEGKHGNSVRPIAQYLDKMMEVMERSKQQLASEQDYYTLVNGLLNEMKEVQVPDLIYAINRFHSFNQKLTDNMPGSLNG